MFLRYLLDAYKSHHILYGDFLFIIIIISTSFLNILITFFIYTYQYLIFMYILLQIDLCQL